MKILFLGDTHGNYPFIRNAFIEYIDSKEIDVVVQCGDFGYWEHKESGVKFLDQVNELCDLFDVDLYWVDGNHENHEKLRDSYSQPLENDFVQNREHIFHIPRGVTWEWDGVKFMGFGGAYSIDKTARTPYLSWWPQEIASESEVLHAESKGEVDVLISHDVPIGTSWIDEYLKNWRPFAGTVESRTKLRAVADSCKPKFIVHGHYHVNYTEVWDAPWGAVRVVGLDSDISAQHYGQVHIVLDTDNPLW